MDELGAVFYAAQTAGALNDATGTGLVLGDFIKKLKTEMLEHPAPADDVVDAEVVEDEPAAEPVTEWPTAKIPGADEAPAADDEDVPF